MVGGGIDNVTVVSDLWMLDVASMAWHAVTGARAQWPAPALFHAAELTPVQCLAIAPVLTSQDGLLVTFGGKDPHGQTSRCARGGGAPPHLHRSTNAISAIRLKIPSLQSLCLHRLHVQGHETSAYSSQLTRAVQRRAHHWRSSACRRCVCACRVYACHVCC